jgi:hypothetical protein
MNKTKLVFVHFPRCGGSLIRRYAYKHVKDDRLIYHSSPSHSGLLAYSSDTVKRTGHRDTIFTFMRPRWEWYVSLWIYFTQKEIPLKEFYLENRTLYEDLKEKLLMNIDIDFNLDMICPIMRHLIKTYKIDVDVGFDEFAAKERFNESEADKMQYLNKETEDLLWEGSELWK